MQRDSKSQIDPIIFDAIAKKIINIRTLTLESEKVESIIDEMLETNAILQTYANNVNSIADQVLHIINKLNELVPALDGFTITVNSKLIELFEFNEAFSRSIIEQGKLNNNATKSIVAISNNIDEICKRINL